MNIIALAAQWIAGTSGIFAGRAERGPKGGAGDPARTRPAAADAGRVR